MPQQGSLKLNDPVARTLPGSANPARLAYAWRDGSPRSFRSGSTGRRSIGPWIAAKGAQAQGSGGGPAGC